MNRGALFLLLSSFWLVGPVAAQDPAASPAVGQVPIPPAPEPTAEEEAAYAAMVQAAVHNYILPAYEQLQQKADALAAATTAYCKDTSAENRAALKARFSDTVVAWAEVDFFRFGAMAEDGRYERFAFFPDVHGTGARQMRQLLARKDTNLLEPGVIAKQSAAVQGLPALEALLHTGKEALIESDAPDAFRCGLAGAIAENLQKIAAAARESWTKSPS